MTRSKTFVAAVAAFLLGVPLAERAVADDASGIVGAAISLAIAITEAAAEGS